MSKPITIQRVSGAMRKARIEASTSSSTRVRGWRNYTSGVRVERPLFNSDYIMVYWVHGSRYTTPTEALWNAKAKMIADALDNAGIKYRRTEGHDASFIVEVNQ